MAWQTAPNAWEDDEWSNKVDHLSRQTNTWSIDSQTKITRSQREALHREENRRIWEQAEDPAALSFLETTNTGVALDDAFRQVRVLSRNPTQPTARLTSKTPSGTSTPGASNTLDDSDEEDKKEHIESFEDKMVRQAKEREERQRKYDEARAKIFGSSAGSNPVRTAGSSGLSTGVNSPQGNNRGRGRGRGGRGRGGQRQPQGFDSRENSIISTEGPHSSRGGKRGGRGASNGPSDSIPPGMGSTAAGNGKETTLLHAVRAPKNPESGNRGGFNGRRGRGGRGGASSAASTAAPHGGISLV